MVDGDEVDQLAVVFHIDVHLLDCGLIVQNIFFDGRFTLEERLHCSFTQSHLIELFLLVADPFLSFKLFLNDLVTAVHGVHHTAHVKKFSLDPDPGFSEWIFPRLDGLIDAINQIVCAWVCHDS